MNPDQLQFDFVESGLRRTTRPPARVTDPVTSQVAATELIDSGKLGRAQTEFMKALAILGKASTAQEVAAEACMAESLEHLSMKDRLAHSETVRKRAGELEQKLHKIVVVGKRICDVTGKMAQTYWYPNAKPNAKGKVE